MNECTNKSHYFLESISSIHASIYVLKNNVCVFVCRMRADPCPRFLIASKVTKIVQFCLCLVPAAVLGVTILTVHTHRVFSSYRVRVRIRISVSSSQYIVSHV